MCVLVLYTTQPTQLIEESTQYVCFFERKSLMNCRIKAEIRQIIIRMSTGGIFAERPCFQNSEK